MKATPIDSKAQEILNKVQQISSSPKVAIVTDRKGDVLEMIVNGQMGKIIELSELTYIAKVISMRYDVADYHKILDGLQMDIGFFKNVFALSTMIDNDKLLMVIIPKTNNLFDLVHIAEDVKNISISALANLIEK
jgi:hypothetical protein